MAEGHGLAVVIVLFRIHSRVRTRSGMKMVMSGDNAMDSGSRTACIAHDMARTAACMRRGADARQVPRVPLLGVCSGWSLLMLSGPGVARGSSAGTACARGRGQPAHWGPAGATGAAVRRGLPGQPASRPQRPGSELPQGSGAPRHGASRSAELLRAARARAAAARAKRLAPPPRPSCTPSVGAAIPPERRCFFSWGYVTAAEACTGEPA